MHPQILRTWPPGRQALTIIAHNLFQNNIQNSLRESSNFQLSCVNISFFPCNKASKLMWILHGTHRDHAGIFMRVATNFLKKLEDDHT